MRFLFAILLLLAAAPAHAQQGQGMSKAMVVSSCGGGALPSGALNQLTMDPQGRLCQSGIGSNICAEAAAYLGRTTGSNEGGNAVNITALICGLVTDGVWPNLDALYVLAQQNQADARLNLVGTSYPLTGTATFTTYQGFSAFSTSANLDTGFNPHTASSPKYALNSASAGVWLYNASEGNVAQMGDNISGPLLIMSSFSGAFYGLVNSASGSVPNPGSTGLFGGDRSSGANFTPYWNGIGQGLQSAAASLPVEVFIGGVQPSYFTVKTLSAAHLGASLGSSGNLALYTRLRTYMTAVGVP